MYQHTDKIQQIGNHALTPRFARPFRRNVLAVLTVVQTSRHALASGSLSIVDSSNSYCRSGSSVANRKKPEPNGWRLEKCKPDANGWRLGWLRRVSRLVVLVMLGFTGCNNLKTDEEEPEHFNPPHWPASMFDAAEKIEVRIAQLTKESSDLEKASDVRDELNDLVEWAPEIAADTDLEESDWDEVYRISETLRAHMASADVPLADYRDDFGRLSELLREFHQKVSATSNPRDTSAMDAAVESEPVSVPASNEVP